MKHLRLRLLWDIIKEMKPLQWFFLLVVISIIILITISGTRGYDSSAERPSFFDKTTNKYK